MKNLLLVSVLAVIVASCADTSAQKQQEEEIAVLERAEELVGAEYHQDFGKWWDMMILSSRNSRMSGADTREEFIQQRKSEFENFRITDYDSSKLIAIGNKYAVTQAAMSYEVREEGRIRSIDGCDRTIWLELPDGWYWHETGRDCGYMPTAQEIENLTRNLR